MSDWLSTAKPTAWSKFLGGGDDENITINHACGGGDCGGIVNSDGSSDGDGGGDGSGGDGGNGGSREKERRCSAGAMTAMSDDDNDDDGYNDDGQQRWQRLPAPVPINGVL